MLGKSGLLLFIVWVVNSNADERDVIVPRRTCLAIAGIPWQLIQRNNNRSACFYHEEGYLYYLENLGVQARKHGCLVHAYSEHQDDN